MEKKLSAAVFGDSIMKFTVFEGGRYRSCFDSVGVLPARFPVTVDNRSHIGFTAAQGLELIRRAAEEGLSADWALVEYGGNDCNFDWEAVAADPDGPHRPAADLPLFLELLGRCADTLVEAGAKPVFMSLPPIDSGLYYRCILSRGIPEEPLLRFLGSPLALYRQQELYSTAVRDFALERGLPFVDVRREFLACRAGAFEGLISPDGLHPTRRGYRIIAQCFAGRLEKVFGRA